MGGKAERMESAATALNQIYGEFPTSLIQTGGNCLRKFEPRKLGKTPLVYTVKLRLLCRGGSSDLAGMAAS